MRNVAVVIPAYRPDARLVSLVSELSNSQVRAIVVVNDGSDASYDSIFAAVSEHFRVIRHAVNRGKGAALKSGIEHALREFPDLRGIVTADADGQHLPADILKVAASLDDHPNCLILGSRVFDRAVPFRSRFGNTFTRYVFRVLIGKHLTDTQTGLRAIPSKLAASLLKLASDGYDFELDMLIEARRQSVEILEQPIQTVYEPGNKSSHFSPLVDSMKIYFVLARFCSVSLATAVIDNIVFYLVFSSGQQLLTAQAAGRAAAVTFNYLMVKERVFRAHGRDSRMLPKYLALVLASGTASYALIHLASSGFGAPVLPAKIVVESLLFFINFAVERDWVFVGPDEPDRGAGV